MKLFCKVHDGSRRIVYICGIKVFEYRHGYALTRTELSAWAHRYADLRLVSRPSPEGNDGDEQSGNIWQMWWQGLESAPDCVRICMESVRKNIRGRRVVVIDRTNYRQYVEIPAHILRKHQEGKISNAHFSDYLRVALLARHGGTWIDATVLVTAPVPSEMLDSKFFVFASPFWQCADVSRLKWRMLGTLHYFTLRPSATLFGSNWWICARKDSAIIRHMVALLEEYWRREDAAVDYLFFYDLLSGVIMENDDCRAEWNRMPKYNNTAPQLLREVLEDEFDDDLYQDILRLSPVHKVSHKFKSLNPRSFHNHLLNPKSSGAGSGRTA